jgi:hypothetical protein
MLRWWNPPTPPFPQSASFEVVCACGSIHRGERRAKHQVVRCTVCGKQVFVLPTSPLLSGQPAAAIAHATVPLPEPNIRNLWPWLWPVFAGAVTLLIVVGAFTALLLYLWPSGPQAPPAPGPESLEQAIAEGRKALEQGDFHFAVEQLDVARGIQVRHPQALTPSGLRRLLHLHRQAHLLVDWPGKSLEDLFSEYAAVRDEDRWRRHIKQDYGNKGFIIDAEVRRDGSGIYHVMTRPSVSPMPIVHLHLEGLEMLKHLPLTDARRLLFGARLAEARRENGTCEVFFETDSGVLLTDVTTANIGLPPIPEPEWSELLKRQREWADE